MYLPRKQYAVSGALLCVSYFPLSCKFYLNLEIVHCFLCSPPHLVREQPTHCAVKFGEGPQLVEATPCIVPCLWDIVTRQLYHSHECLLQQVLVGVNQPRWTIVVNRGKDVLGSGLPNFTVAVSGMNIIAILIPQTK